VEESEEKGRVVEMKEEKEVERRVEEGRRRFLVRVDRRKVEETLDNSMAGFSWKERIWELLPKGLPDKRGTGEGEPRRTKIISYVETLFHVAKFAGGW